MACTRKALEIYRRDVTPKISKSKQSFLYVTYFLSLIYIAIKFHRDNAKGYLVIGCIKIVLKNNQRAYHQN